MDASGQGRRTQARVPVGAEEPDVEDRERSKKQQGQRHRSEREGERTEKLLHERVDRGIVYVLNFGLDSSVSLKVEGGGIGYRISASLLQSVSVRFALGQHPQHTCPSSIHCLYPPTEDDTAQAYARCSNRNNDTSRPRRCMCRSRLCRASCHSSPLLSTTLIRSRRSLVRAMRMLRSLVGEWLWGCGAQRRSVGRGREGGESVRGSREGTKGRGGGKLRRGLEVLSRTDDSQLARLALQLESNTNYFFSVDCHLRVRGACIAIRPFCLLHCASFTASFRSIRPITYLS